MELYYIIFSVLALLSWSELSGMSRSMSKKIFIAVSVFMFVLSSIRWETGTDWTGYYMYYKDATYEFNGMSQFEWGYSLVSEIAKLIFNSYTALLIMLGAITIGLQNTAVWKLSPMPLTSLLFLWSVSFGNVFFIRQTIATAIMLYSVVYIKERKLWPFLISVGIAMTFHKTSIIFIAAWWLYKIRPKPWIILLVMLSCFIISSSICPILEMIYDKLEYGQVKIQLRAYLDDRDSTFGATLSRGMIIAKGVANKIMLLIVCMLAAKDINKTTPEFQGYLNIYTFGILVYLSMAPISVAFIRFSFAFDILQIILLPMILYHYRHKRWIFPCYCVTLLYFILRLSVALSGSYYDLYVPYKTFLSQ